MDYHVWVSGRLLSEQTYMATTHKCGVLNACPPPALPYPGIEPDRCHCRGGSTPVTFSSPYGLPMPLFSLTHPDLVKTLMLFQSSMSMRGVSAVCNDVTVP